MEKTKKNYVEENKDEKKPVDLTEDQLRLLLKQFISCEKPAHARKTRIEALMQRPGTKKWLPQKTAKMVRRLISVTQEIQYNNDVIEKINAKLNSLVEIVPV